MESPQKKKLAVVAGKRVAAPEEEETPDASMEDLCRKKFKPIAPKPVIRKDQHQAVLSTTLPVRNDAGARKENVVLPSLKQDPNNMYVMKPGSSLPFMCGGPMIMPIPVPVVPGKDGSYVPLQVPVPIPVMVPVVVSLNQAMSPSGSTVFAASKASHHSGSDESSSTKKGAIKKGHSKPDQSSQPGSGMDGKGTKPKPCRYKYSMIKNEALLRDLMRGVGGDFMASHGINFQLPSKDAANFNNLTDKNETSTSPGGKNVEEDVVHEKEKDGQSQNAALEKSKVPADTVTKGLSSTVIQSNAQETVCSAQGVTSSASLDQGSHRAEVVFSPQIAITCTPTSSTSPQTVSSVLSHRSTVGQQSCGEQLMSSHLSQSVCTTVSHSNSRVSEAAKSQRTRYSTGTTSMNQDQYSISTFAGNEARGALQIQPAQSSTSSQVRNVPSSLPCTCNSSTFVISSASSSTAPVSSAITSQTHGTRCTNATTESVRNGHWNVTAGNHVRSLNESLSNASSKPSQSFPMRPSVDRFNSLDDSNLCSMDEMHSFSVEMDNSALSTGSLMGSSDDSVSGVLAMSHAGGLMTSALSDSPTRRAVTAIVTPLPRSIPLTASTSTITSVATQLTEMERGLQPIPRQSNTTTMSANQNKQTSTSVVTTTVSVTTGSSVPPWTHANNSQQSRPQPSAQEIPTSTHQRLVDSQMSTNHSGERVHFNQPSNVTQQKNQHASEIQRQSMTVSSSTAHSKQMSHAPSYMTNSHSSSMHSSVSYSSCPTAPVTNQRQLPSSSGVGFSTSTLNVHQSVSSTVHSSNSSQSSGTSMSQCRSEHSVQGRQSLQDNRINARSTNPYPSGNRGYSSNANLGMNSATKNQSRQSNRSDEIVRHELQNSGVTATLGQQQTVPSRVMQTSVASSTYSMSSNFTASNSSTHTSNRLHSFASVVSSQPYTGSSGGVQANAGAGRNAPGNTSWQSSWSDSSTPRQTHPPFSSSTNEQVMGSHSFGEHVDRTKQNVPSGRSEGSNAVVTTSVQSVPLQSNVQARPSATDTLEPSSRNHVHRPNISARVCQENNVFHPDQSQVPAYTNSHQRQVPVSQPMSASFGVPRSESGPRMPYPLVPPIMFGNSTPVPSMPMGGIHSVPVPGRFPNQGISEQQSQTRPVVSSSPSTVHRPVAPMAHDRHRMYLPSQFSSLHRPLYMSPSPGANSDLPLLSPHSYGQLHVHDNVLYSPRYPSSLHSLSPGVSSSFPSSSLHRDFPPADHLDTYSRNHMSHPAPTYDGSASAASLRMPQTEPSNAAVVSSQAVQIPPSLPPLFHSSILANREQNSIFEQNLQRLLERSARRHCTMFASPHSNMNLRSMPYDVPHRYGTSPATFSSGLQLHPPSTTLVTASEALSRPHQTHAAHQPRPRLPTHPVSSSVPGTTASATTTTSIAVTSVSTTNTPTTSTVVTSRAVLGNMSDKYLPLELLTSESSTSQTTPTPSVSTASPQVANDQVVKCGDTVLQCSRQVLRESGRTVLCCWFCDYHTAEPRKMRRHQKKEGEPMKCQLCSFHGDSRCAVNQHYKQEHMDKDDPFRAIPP